MNSQILSWFPIIISLLISFIKLSLFAQVIPLSLSYPDEGFYRSCGISFSCGSIAGVDYPFRGKAEPDYCGHPGFVLDCRNNFATIDIKNLTYRVLEMNQAAETMKIAREDVMEETCPRVLVNTTVDDELFEYTSDYTNLTFLYGCLQAPPTEIPNIIEPVPSCSSSGKKSVYLVPESPVPLSPICEASVTVQVAGRVVSVNSTELEQAVRRGLEVRWKVDSSACSDCIGSKGRCGYSLLTGQTTCYCPDPPYVSGTCSTTESAGY